MAGNKTSRPAVDWERIEADFRAGVLSLREIADGHSVSHVSIAKRAKRDGWERDLGPAIKAKADSLVNRELVNSKVNSGNPANDRAIVEANAEAIASVRLKHRSTIRRSRELVDALLIELESQTHNVELIEKLDEILAQAGDGVPDKLSQMYQAVTALPGRAKTLKDLADSLQRLINLERDAYGINDESKESDASKGRAERLAAARARLSQ